MKRGTILSLTLSLLSSLISLCAAAQPANQCAQLPDHDTLKRALTSARQQKNGGLNNDMWGVLVDRDGIVCAVVYTGKERGDQWPGSRLIAAEKANTANAFSTATFALSTANLFFASQPAGFLYGIITSNPVNPAAPGLENAPQFGETNDPMVGKAIGGVIVFGGGLALYNKEHKIVGGLGVSGDSSCADHNIAWRTRQNLELDYVPAGVSGKLRPDNIVYDISPVPNRGSGVSPSGYGHPVCHPDVTAIANGLPETRK